MIKQEAFFFKRNLFGFFAGFGRIIKRLLNHQEPFFTVGIITIASKAHGTSLF